MEFVLECMNLHGGEDYGNLYKCSCMLDRMASSMSYDDYVEADTWYRGRTTRGERGNIFRDVPRGREERSKLEQVRDQAEQRCFGGAHRSCALTFRCARRPIPAVDLRAPCGTA